jgi:DNA-binding MarR family transcriptional regulator
VLVDTFWIILKVEEQTIHNSAKIDLTINEMHLIEAIGKDENKGKTISDLADEMYITRPSVTIAVNKLEKKGYVNKIKDEKDGRMVLVTLTKKGVKMDTIHRYFHENMVRNIGKEFTDEEKEVLIHAIEKLNIFFRSKLVL